MTIDFLVHPESCLAEISTILSFRVMHLFYIAKGGSLVFDNSQRYLEFFGSDLLRPPWRRHYWRRSDQGVAGS